jgi:hypothetical protein
MGYERYSEDRSVYLDSGAFDESVFKPVRCTRADRDEVAEKLSQHYEAGSLDDEEFRVRLDQALGAKFRNDFNGLLGDLPVLPVAPAVPVSKSGVSVHTSQNVAAFVAACAVFPLGALGGDSLFVIPLLVTCVINTLLGYRKSPRMAALGFVSGLFYFPGTALMILLTRTPKS